MDHPLDSTVKVTDKGMVLIDKVDDMITQALTTGNPLSILEFGAQLRQARHISGLALAKLLFRLREVWDHFDTDDKLRDVAYEHIGVSGYTYQRYIDCWQYVAMDRHELWNKPIGGLLLCIAAAKEDQLGAKHWKQIEKAPNKATIRDVIKEVRGTTGGGVNALRIWLREDGALQAVIGDGVYKPVGFIERSIDNKLAIAVIARFEKAGLVVEAAE